MNKLTITLAAALLVAAATPARAQAYDNTTIHIDNNSGSDAYIAFQSPFPFTITYSNLTGVTQNITQNLTFNGTTSSWEGSGFSASLNIADVQFGNFSVYNGTSVASWVSFGSALNVTAAPAAASSNDPNYNVRYQPFEFTRVDTDLIHANGDITAINYFSAAIHIENFSGNYGSLVSHGNSGVKNVATGDLMRDSYNSLSARGAANFTTNTTISYPATIVTTSNTTSGNFVRITAPNTFPKTAGDDFPFGSYPSFGNYFTYLHDNSVNTTIASTHYQIATWKYDYTFDAHVDASGNFILAGNITASDLFSTANITVSGLMINLPNDVDGELSYNMYQAQYPLTANVQITGNWAGIYEAQPVGGGGNQTAFNASVKQLIEQQILGDLAEGINVGALGSNVAFMLNGNLVAVGNMTSEDWFTFDPHNFYGNVAASSDFYNIYAESLIANAGNESVSYYSPYDDRFQNVPGANPDIAMETLWVVTLNPDGNLAVVPEPATCAIIMSGIGLLFVTVYRRKSRAAAANNAIGASPPGGPPV